MIFRRRQWFEGQGLPDILSGQPSPQFVVSDVDLLGFDDTFGFLIHVFGGFGDETETVMVGPGVEIMSRKISRYVQHLHVDPVTGLVVQRPLRFVSNAEAPRDIIVISLSQFPRARGLVVVLQHDDQFAERLIEIDGDIGIHGNLGTVSLGGHTGGPGGFLVQDHGHGTRRYGQPPEVIHGVAREYVHTRIEYHVE